MSIVVYMSPPPQEKKLPKSEPRKEDFLPPDIYSWFLRAKTFSVEELKLECVFLGDVLIRWDGKSTWNTTILGNVFVQLFPAIVAK